MDVKITKTDGDVIAINNVASVETDPPMTAPPAETGRKVFKITDAPYNAGVNKSPTENATAIQKCYSDAKAQNADVEIPAGKYIYDKTLIHENITVFNNGELFGNGPNVGYYMRAGNPKLIGGTLSHDNTGVVRQGQMYNHGIAVYDQSGEFEIIDVHIINPAAAGICVWDGRGGRIVGCLIEDSLADGMHHVASQDGRTENMYERGNTVRRSGDDCLSFVTYSGTENNLTVVRNCEVWDFRGEDNTWGRGITVLGAEGIVINGAILNRIHNFGLFVGIESGYGAVAKAVLNDVKVDVCGSWATNSDTQDGLLITGWNNQVSCELNNCVISRPKRHGVLRYHKDGNEFINNNTIFSQVTNGEEIYEVGAPSTQSYSSPKHGEPFKSPKESKAD